MLVVNTCSFIDSAKQESVDTILEMAQHKTTRPRAQADRGRVPGGALSRRDPQEHPRSRCGGWARANWKQILDAAGLGQRRPAPAAPQLFNILTAPATAASCASDMQLRQRRMLRRLAPPRGPKAICASSRDASRASMGRRRSRRCPRICTTRRRRGCWPRGKTSAYIKIAEGCDHPCTFCIIPNLRGKFRSRRFESVVAEAERLVAQRRARDHADRAGHDLLRRGFRIEGWPGGAAGPAGADRGPQLAALSLRLSQQDHRPAAGNHREARQHRASTSTCRCSTLPRRC